MPDRSEVNGLAGSVSVTVRVPVRSPRAVGVNTTRMVQDPGAKLLPQVPPVTAKSPEAEDDMPETVPDSVLVRVNVSAGLGLPTSSLIKGGAAGDGVRVTVPPVVPVPESEELTILGPAMRGYGYVKGAYPGIAVVLKKSRPDWR